VKKSIPRVKECSFCDSFNQQPKSHFFECRNVSYHIFFCHKTTKLTSFPLLRGFRFESLTNRVSLVSPPYFFSLPHMLTFYFVYGFSFRIESITLHAKSEGFLLEHRSACPVRKSLKTDPAVLRAMPRSTRGGGVKSVRRFTSTTHSARLRLPPLDPHRRTLL
jgi:hypothetical protein